MLLDDWYSATAAACWLLCIIMPSVARLVSNEGEVDRRETELWLVLLWMIHVPTVMILQSPRAVSSAKRS